MSTPIEELIIGESSAVVELREKIVDLASASFSVLIEGPTGTGKELVAQALHMFSGRTGRFVAVNVSAIAETMFESELFGHEKGAFTGAMFRRKGFLQEADGGTLFLDEIGKLSPAMQPKLLRAIETKSFRPVGASADVRSDFRLVSATNEGITAKMRIGEFRTDLAHRIGALPLRTTSLDDRKKDIPLLVAAFLKQMRERPDRFTPGAVFKLASLDWPGNVRQLRQFVEVSLAMRQGVVTVDAIDELESIRLMPSEPQLEQEYERRLMLELLENHSGRKDEVAAQLGIHLSTLYRRLRQLRIGRRSVRLQ